MITQTQKVARQATLHHKPIAALAFVALAGTLLWVVLMAAGGGPPATFDAAIEKVRLDALFYATYLNAACLTTVPVTMLMAALFGTCKPHLPQWAGLVAIVFVPVYCLLNLLAYLSQITVVPVLIEMSRHAETRGAADVLLMLTLQELPGSAVSFFNLLAYAILGIPSLIFGIALARRPGRWLRAAGILLAISPIGSITGLVGAVAHVEPLRAGVVVSGGLFLFALAALGVGFARAPAGHDMGGSQAVAAPFPPA